MHMMQDLASFNAVLFGAFIDPVPFRKTTSEKIGWQGRTVTLMPPLGDSLDPLLVSTPA